MLSRQIIYALFSQPVVGFLGLSLKTPPRLCPWTDPTRALSLDPAGDFRPQTLNLPTPIKNPEGGHDNDTYLWQVSLKSLH